MKGILLALIICVAWSGIASAVPKFINAAGDNSFTNALNWDSALVPGPADVVTGGADQAKLWTGDIATWASTLSIGSSSSSTGELTVEGGTLGATYTFNIATYGDGVVTVNGGDVTSLRFFDIGYSANKTGTLNLNGGSMQTTQYDIDIGRVAGALGILNMSGGHLTAQRWFYVGEAGAGVMTMTGGTNTVILYDVSVANQATGSGTLNMYGGYMDVTRDFIVGERGIGVMTMTNGVIDAGGTFRVAELAGSSGQIDFSGGTIYAADFMIGAGTNAPGMVVFSGSAAMILPGDKVSAIQGYIDDGYLTGADVILTNGMTVVGEAPPLPPPEQIHVSAFGAVPDDGQDDAAAIQAAVDAAVFGDTVLFDAGVYDLISSTNDAHILVRYKTGITLSGAVTNGAPATRLLRHVNLANRATLPQLIYNRDNTDITIENFIMDNSPRYTTAGPVVAKDPGGAWIRVQLFDGLPMDAGVGCASANAWLPTDPPVFKNVRSLTYGTSPANWTIYDGPNRIMELNAGASQLDFIDLIDVGEIMSWHYGAMGNNMMYNGYNNGMVLRNIRVPNAINAFANLIYSRDVILQDITLRSDNSCPAVGPRDGFHLSSNGGTLRIENVDIEGVRLDPIVLRTRYGHIDRVTDSTHFHIEALMGGVDMPAESRLGLWSAGGELEYLEVSSAIWNSTPSSGYDIVTASPLPAWAGVGTELKMSAFMPDSGLIAGCDFKNNAGSDVICFVDNVTFSNNTHFKATDAAIHLGSNNSSAGVCGNNIKILDSVFTACGWGGKNSAFGAVSMNNLNAYQTAKITNLEIRGNTFNTQIGLEAVALRDLDGCEISDNTFSSVSEAVSIDQATVSNVGVSNNTMVGVASASDSWDGREAVYAVNGAGMSGDAHASETPVNQTWMGADSSLPKWFKMDLGYSYELDAMQIYNFNWAGYTSRGCRNVQIFYSNAAPDPGNPVDNPGNWTTVGSAFDLTQAPGDSTYGTTHPTQPDTVALSVTARWVAIKVNNNYGGGYCGLSEVRIRKTPIQIKDIQIVDGEVLFSWDSVDSVNYNVWTNDDLVSGEWGIDTVVPGAGGSATMTSSVTDAEALFYKVEQD